MAKAAAAKAGSMGFQEGYGEGVKAGRLQFGKLIDGPSIIIPVRNELHLLRDCLIGMECRTPLPYEIIVMDNASTDGTGEYLESLGGIVRFRTLESARGWAGAVNLGLMMAKGRTIVVLHGGTRVEGNWMPYLLRCLYGDSRIGAVSLGGNRIAIRRETFEETGYFDEGMDQEESAIRDYLLRVRLTGRSHVDASEIPFWPEDSIIVEGLAARIRLSSPNGTIRPVGWNA